MKSITRVAAVASQLILLILVSSYSSVQAAGEVDTSFRANLTTFGTGHAYKATVQPDGKILIASTGGLVSGVFRSYLTRLNADGTVDLSFNPPAITSFSVDILVIAVQPNGKILIGGTFATATRSALIRLNSDGSLDETFTLVLPIAFGYTINDIVFYPDGRMLIGGKFSINNLPGGAQRHNLARLDADGNVDLTFQAVGAYVRRIILQPDGKIIRASYIDNFPQSHDIQRNNSDGSNDNTFAFAGASNFRDMVLQADGRVLIGSLGSEPLRRLNADGTNDISYPAFTINGGIHVITPDSVGKFYIAGEFTQINGNSAYEKVARLNSDGTLDPTFSYTAHNFPKVQDLAIQSDGQIVVAGDGVAPPNIQNPLTRVNTDGSPDTSFRVPIAVNFGTGYKVLVQADNKAIVGGTFEAAGGFKATRLARFNADGTFDTSFTPPNYSIASGSIQDLALQADGKILVTGFGMGLAHRLNTNGTLDVNLGFSSQNRAEIEYQSNGTILLGGTNLERYLANGQWADELASISGGTLPQIYEIAVQPDGKILIGGVFTNVNGVSRVGFARLNGTTGVVDSSFNPLVNGSVLAIVVLPDGKILIGGDFTSVAGDLTKKHLARLNADGTLDTSFSAVLNGPVLGLKIQPDGRILMGGAMSVVNGASRIRIARLHQNGSLDASFDPGSGADSSVWSIDLQSDGKIVYAGEFDRTNGFATPGVGRLLNASVPTAKLFDYDGDGKADVSVFRPSENRWYVFRSSDWVVTQQVFAIAGDVPVPADYDGDQKTDIAIYRPSSGAWWYLSSLNGAQITVQWGGEAGDVPRPSDFDGDGKSDFVFFRPTNNFWYRITSGGIVSNVQFGSSGDKPVRGDFDGDGKFDVAIFRPSTGDWWYLSSINGAQLAVHWGISTDIPAAADFDGDGRTDFAVYRPSTGVWYIMNSSNGSSTIMAFGLSEDKPVPADYDGDGKADIAVFRPSTGVWYLQRSTSGFTAMQFGVATDIPTENAFVP